LWQCLHETDLESYKKFGKFHGFYEGRQPVLLVGDPEIIKQLLVKNFNSFTDRRFIKMDEKNKIIEKILLVMQGEEWRLARHYLSPTFTTGKLKQMGRLMEECAQDIIEKLQDKVKTTGVESLDVKAELGKYTMNVIATCAFGITTKDQSAVDPFFHHLKAMFGQNFSLKFFIFLLSPKLANFLGLEVFPSASRDFFYNTAKQVIDMRRKDGTRRPDFLQLLLDAQQEEATENSTSNEKSKVKNVLDDECIIAQVISFLLAGFDNVASALSFALYLLALNPKCQAKLYEEIQEAKKKHGENIPFDVIMQMTYADMILLETLRLYPSLARLERVCTKDCLLGDVHVKKGMVTLIPAYALHHDAQFFPEPEIFDPERFNDDNKSSINPYVYMPFGAGPRNCMGMRFAQMSTKVGLVYALDKFTFSQSKETEIPIKMTPGFPGLQAVNGVRLKVELRK
jgi:cytochrome P450